MTSCFHIMGKCRYRPLASYSQRLARWRRDEVCYCRLPCLITNFNNIILPNICRKSKKTGVFRMKLDRYNQKHNRLLSFCSLWSPYVIGQTIIFSSCSFFLSSSIFFFFFFPRLISAVGDWISTILLHMAWP